MHKVQKFNAKCVFEDKNGEKVPCVKLNFQVNKWDAPPKDGFQLVDVYRREEPDFRHDYDEWEYFEGLVPREEDLIFSGEVEISNTFSEFSDYDVEIGKVYVYWIGKGDVGVRLSAPRPIKVRDPYIWWSFDEILSRTYALRDRFGATVRQFGRTVLGKPLNAVTVGNRDSLIACIGAVHAGESGPEILLRALERILERDPHAFDRCGIAVMPVVNADMREQMACGVAPWYNRLNLVGVDINRNFDADWSLVDRSYNLSSDDSRSPTYRGTCPNSEPETRAVTELLDQLRPVAVFSYHYMSSITGDRLLSASVSAEDEEYRELCNRISRAYSDGFRDGMNEPRANNTETVFACTGGSLASYAYRRLGVPAFDIETSVTDLLEMKARCTCDKATREDLDRTVDGHEKAILKIVELFS